MNLDNLHIFCKVVESGSISEAARKLFITQPSISIMISELENHFQVKLLERTNKGVKATEQGLFLYHEGQKMLSMAKNLEHGLGQTNNNPPKELHLGSSSVIGGYILPSQIIQLQELYPQYKIYLNIDNSYKVIMRVVDNSLDMGFVEGPLQNDFVNKLTREGLILEQRGEEELVLVTSSNYEQPGKNVDWEALKELPLILLSRGTEIYSTIETTLTENTISTDKLNIIMEVNQIDAAITAVKASKGFSLLPKSVLLENDLIMLSINEITFKHKYHFIYDPANISNNAVKFFLNHFHENGIKVLPWNLYSAS